MSENPINNILKNYEPENIEKKWYDFWMEKGYFKTDIEKTDAPTYSIMLPPPNVTGTLHMGHGFQQTIMDILVRYHKMKGFDVLWQCGTDHAGIATQMVVERNLNSQNISRHDLGREKFLEKVWEWKEQSGDTITSQMKRLGLAIDWDRSRFTMDKKMTEAVVEQFVQLHNEGLIYKGLRLVNWDPILNTAVSDLEVVQKEEDGHMWYIKYPLSGSDQTLTIATTRPETMLGDIAVAVHPSDDRYAKLIGKTINLPLTNRKISIIADDYVEKDFGTGCVKITPAHDFNDYEIGKRHKLEMINILTENGDLNDNVPLKYQGLSVLKARKIIINDLEKLNLLEKVVSHKLKIPRGDRTGAIIEPYLTKQWFLNTKDLAQPAIDAVESGDIKFVPDNWKNTYYSWMNDLQDWCISRQLWWGHRIPAWYDEQGKIYVARDEQEVRNKYNLEESLILKQDEDVFDTWFSSALWSFSTLGWPKKTTELSKYYPSSVLVTGFDIIFFWVARMIMSGLKFMGDVPFKYIYITGLIRDENGDKMSKSKGNVLDPVDLIDGISLENLLQKRTAGLMQPKMKSKIEKQTKKEFPNGISAFGTDALRFTFSALASTSRDISFDLSRMEGYRNFCNKLWNASRFIMMNVKNSNVNPLNITDKDLNFSLVDKWIYSELDKTIELIENSMKSYRFDLVAKEIYDFVWHKYCDWYLEFVKSSMKSENIKEKSTAIYVVIDILNTVLKLSHPIIPFITEEIYENLKIFTVRKHESLMVSSYPEQKKAFKDTELIEKNILFLQKIIISVRTLRAEINVKPSVNVNIYIKNLDDKEVLFLKKNIAVLSNLAKVSNLIFVDKESIPESSMQSIGKIEIHLPLLGLIDVEVEVSRLKKNIDKIEKEGLKLSSRLKNKNFIKNAPAEIVELEQEKLKNLKHQISNILLQIKKMNLLK